MVWSFVAERRPDFESGEPLFRKLREGKFAWGSRPQADSPLDFLEAGIIAQIVELWPSLDHDYVGFAVCTSLLQ